MRKTACLATLTFAVAIAISCSTESRLRLKNFFFEIPQPAPVAAVAPESGVAVPETEKSDEPGSQLAANVRSIHEPYRAHQCSACHTPSQYMKPKSNFMDTCAECHEDYFSDRVTHAPVSEGECLACHNPHRSSHLALLNLSVLETCADCHDYPEDLSQPAHAGDNASNCIACHDAHFGGEFLLKPGRPNSRNGK